MKRRLFLAGSAAGAVAAASFQYLERSKVRPKNPLLLVHGSWSGAFAFSKVIPLLMTAGYSAFAEDLPGHGLNSQYPRSYLKRPLDRNAFATETSPLRNLSFAQQTDAVIEAVRRLESLYEAPIVLVGHSSAGVLISAVAEQIPNSIKHLVYIAAVLPPPGMSSDDCFLWPEAAKSRVGELLFPADYDKIGALRMDPRGDDPKFFKLAKEILYPEVSDALCEAILALQSPDTPLSTHGTKLVVTGTRWGSLPRSYICTSRDLVIPLAFQQRMVQAADQLTPSNKTRVATIDSSHTPSLAQPDELSRLILQLISH